MTEKTLVLLKPDAVKRGLTGEVLRRFERAGLRVTACKMLQGSSKMFEKHYAGLENRVGKKVKAKIVAFMSSGPVIAAVIEGQYAVRAVRKLVGSALPIDSTIGTIRGDFSTAGEGMVGDNLVHASGTHDEASVEISLWFKPEEIFSKQTGRHEKNKKG